MLLIVDALTVMYLRPYLIANGYPEAEVDKVQIWYDPSQVATRNDRAADADSGFEKMAVSFDSWRRAHGFSEGDAPSPNELATRLLISKGMLTPETSIALLTTIAPEIMNATRQMSQEQSVAPIPPEIDQILQEATGVDAPGGEETEVTPPQPLAEPEI
jgi:hypothetical protein